MTLKTSRSPSAALLLTALLAPAAAPAADPREQVPEKLVVLTFDDAVKSHYTVVRPLLLRHGFGATFFVTEGWDFATNKKDYMSWEEIAQLHRDGFEIGNHTRDHLGITEKTAGRLSEQLAAIEAKCVAHGIPKPVTFAWPGNAFTPDAFAALRRHGILFARRGGAPEYSYQLGRGVAYEPGRDHPLLLPSAADARPFWKLEDLVRGAVQATGGKIAILQFHGVPDTAHPWVSSTPERFAEYLDHLADNGYRAIALRDLKRWIDPADEPEEFNAVIEERKAAIEKEEAAVNR